MVPVFQAVIAICFQSCQMHVGQTQFKTHDACEAALSRVSVGLEGKPMDELLASGGHYVAACTPLAKPYVKGDPDRDVRIFNRVLHRVPSSEKA